MERGRKLPLFSANAVERQQTTYRLCMGLKIQEKFLRGYVYEKKGDI